MNLDELKEEYGSWSNAAVEIRVTWSSICYWRKIGYIPYSSQCLIEKNTKGKFKANKEHDLKRSRRKKDDEGSSNE